MSRPRGPRVGPAFLGSVALHAGVIAAVAAAAMGADAAPRQVRVYRVDIVSPAPNVLGEPPAEPPSPAPAEPQEAPEPVAEPAPPEPRPEPDPPAETPKQAPPRETPKRPPPARTEETPRRTETPKNREPARPSTGTGTRPVPATGRNPDPSSAGGEGLNVRTRGVACPENYCNNVVRQVRRFFRAPEGTQGASGNVCFTLHRDGSVQDVTVERQRGGGFAFRLALVEAVEQAGLQNAFGALPGGFQAESIQLCVLMSPETT